jgi:hypothetical protein
MTFALTMACCAALCACAGLSTAGIATEYKQQSRTCVKVNDQAFGDCTAEQVRNGGRSAGAVLSC